MDDINLTIKDKIVTATASVPIVCGNTYHFVVNFDDEWENVTNKVGRIRFGAEYYDIPFQGTDFSATMPFDVPLIEVGVYSDSVITTSGAKLRMVQAILSGNGTYVEFSDELYEQYKTEMSDMLVDQSLDPTSNHAVSNKVVADNYVRKTGDAVPQVVTGTGGIQVQGDLSVGGDLTVSETGSVHFDGSDMEVGGMAIEKDSTATVLSNEAGGIRFKGSVTVPTTATGVKTQDAVNGQRLQADLDAYAPMVRTTGNQEIAGNKRFYEMSHLVSGSATWEWWKQNSDENIMYEGVRYGEIDGETGLIKSITYQNVVGSSNDRTAIRIFSNVSHFYIKIWCYSGGALKGSKTLLDINWDETL